MYFVYLLSTEKRDAKVNVFSLINKANLYLNFELKFPQF